MKVAWLINTVVAKHVRDADHTLFDCPIASARLRAGVAAREFERRGHENVYLVPDEGPVDEGLRGAQVCVVTKFDGYSDAGRWAAATAAAQAAGCRLVVDVSDNPFHKAADVAAYYARTLPLADVVTVNSEAMADAITAQTGRATEIVEDPVLAAPRRPEFAPGKRLELLWFGHPTNAPYLVPWLAPITAYARERACRLTVVSAAQGAMEQVAQEVHRLAPQGLDAQFVPWTLEATAMALRKCDLVLLPSDTADPRKAGASSNRLAEAINAGRLAIASPLRSYQPFAAGAWLGDDPIEGVRWALAHRGEVLARVKRGQQLVAERVSAARIAARWVEICGLV